MGKSLSRVITIAPLSVESIDGVADIHLQAFRDYANGLLGREYAKRFLGWFAAGTDRIALIARDDAGLLAGYVVGARLGYQREMQRALAPTVARALIRRPWILSDRRVLSAFARKFTAMFRRFSHSDLERPDNGVMSLVAIGVSSGHRGAGVGKALMAAFEEMASTLGSQTARLSVYRNNVTARGLYEKAGWTPLDVPGSTAMYYYKEL